MYPPGGFGSGLPPLHAPRVPSQHTGLAGAAGFATGFANSFSRGLEAAIEAARREKAYELHSRAKMKLLMQKQANEGLVRPRDTFLEQGRMDRSREAQVGADQRSTAGIVARGLAQGDADTRAARQEASEALAGVDRGARLEAEREMSVADSRQAISQILERYTGQALRQRGVREQELHSRKKELAGISAANRPNVVAESTSKAADVRRMAIREKISETGIIPQSILLQGVGLQRGVKDERIEALFDLHGLGLAQSLIERFRLHNRDWEVAKQDPAFEALMKQWDAKAKAAFEMDLPVADLRLLAGVD